MRDLRFARLLIGVAAAGVVSIAATTRGAGVCQEDELCGRLFVIVVGVNNAGDKWVAKSAESDTRLLGARLSHGGADKDEIDSLVRVGKAGGDEAARTAAAALMNSEDTISRLQMVVMAGPQATLQNVRTAFEAVIRKARAGDTFVFSFGGVSRSVKGPAGDEHYLAVGGLRNFLDDAELKQKGLSVRQLRQWMDNVAATQQLILVEAGNMQQFLPDFVASIVKSRPSIAQVSRKDRIIFAPRLYGIERSGPDQTVRGVLGYLISTTDQPIFDLFFPSKRVAAEAAFRRRADVIAGQNEYLRVFYERDFLDLYARVCCR